MIDVHAETGTEHDLFCILCDRCHDAPIVDFCCGEHGQVLCERCLKNHAA